jgi:hypothetical protein
MSEERIFTRYKLKSYRKHSQITCKNSSLSLSQISQYGVLFAHFTFAFLILTEFKQNQRHTPLAEDFFATADKNYSIKCSHFNNQVFLMTHNKDTIS